MTLIIVCWWSFFGCSVHKLWLSLMHFSKRALPSCPRWQLTRALPLQARVILGIEIPANRQARGLEEPYWLRRPTFRHLRQVHNTETNSIAKFEERIDFAKVFATAEISAQASLTVTNALAAKISKVLFIPMDDLNMGQPMHLFGVDCLIAVELRNWFAKEIGADMAIFDILGGATLSGIGMLAAGKRKFRKT